MKIGIERTVIATPVGPLELFISPAGLHAIRYGPVDDAACPPVGHLAHCAVAELLAYFTDPHQCFTLPLVAMGTPFQRRVWWSLRDIPVGEVRSYGQVARQLGSGPRAVGGACRANPWPLVVPCHRVVGCRGLVGYAGQTVEQGIAIKRWLLRHEGVAVV
jgi:methylated-DNA-[protein]-cysteine S-methyltransferase